MSVTNNNGPKGNYFQNIKNDYVLRHIFNHLSKNKLFQILKYNKYIQKRLEININDYKDFKKIIILITPINIEDENYFINISDEQKDYYHIYFNNDTKESKNDYFTEDDDVTKIKIIIDEEIKSFKDLFNGKDCIEKIEFKQFNRNDITDMSNMFIYCSSLKEIREQKKFLEGDKQVFQ